MKSVTVSSTSFSKTSNNFSLKFDMPAEFPRRALVYLALCVQRTDASDGDSLCERELASNTLVLLWRGKRGSLLGKPLGQLHFSLLNTFRHVFRD